MMIRSIRFLSRKTFSFALVAPFSKLSEKEKLDSIKNMISNNQQQKIKPLDE